MDIHAEQRFMSRVARRTGTLRVPVSERLRVFSGEDNTLKLWSTPDNWQDLLRRGCDRLRLHPLLASPGNDTAGATCLQHGGWKKTEQAEFVVRQGKAWVQEKGDGDKAMQKLKQVKEFDPNLNLATLKTQLAPDFMQRREKLVKEGNVKEALTAYENAQNFDQNLQILPKFWNNLCRHGSLNSSAKEVPLYSDQLPLQVIGNWSLATGH